MSKVIEIGKNALIIEEVLDIATSKVTVKLCEDKGFISDILLSREFLDDYLKKEGVIYGVTTGYGDSCERPLNQNQIPQLPINLTRYHRCGLGDFFTPQETRAIQVSRLCSLVQGKSGVSLELLELLITQLNQGITPKIPKEGSVGASGDLTPLSYLASTLIGEGEVYFKGQYHPTKDIYKELSITPIKLKPKEGLALMNGTAVMTALACEAYSRASYLCQLSSRITALSSLSLLGNPKHFDDFIFAAKPHPGQREVARWIHKDLNPKNLEYKPARLQERYSIRCAPHVIGVLSDALPLFKKLIETELNSVNDNPIIDTKNEMILHGGNFYGGHIAFVMDSLKTLVANIADLLDRQFALLVDEKSNHGLPANLTGVEGHDIPLHHGLKAVQISASAWTAEALKNTMPVSVFSRSTECHNQDKVSMGTISARDCLRVIELTEQVAASMTLASCQALHLRVRQKELSEKEVSRPLLDFKENIFQIAPFIKEDRPLDEDLRELTTHIKEKSWDLY